MRVGGEICGYKLLLKKYMIAKFMRMCELDILKSLGLIFPPFKREGETGEIWEMGINRGIKIAADYWVDI